MVRITRRGLLSSGAAAGILASSGLPLYAAGRRGGALRVGLAGASLADNWDSRGHRDAFMMVAAHGCVFDCLTEIAADGSLRGELAEGWEANARATEWTFRLRRGVTFHDGQPFTAEDVIASFARHKSPVGLSPAAPIVERIDRMQALASDILKITLTDPDPDFPILLSDPRLVILPANSMDTALRDGIGTGLYRVKRFEPGHLLRAERVASHYKDDQAGWFDEVTLRAMNDPRERAEALAAGRIDVANRLSAGGQGASITSVGGNQFYALHRPTDARHPLSDSRLWQALRSGLNRSALSQHLGGTHVGRDSPLGPANALGISGRDPATLDPAATQRLLEAAGVGALSLELCAPVDLECAPYNEVIGTGVPVALPPLHLTRHFGRPTEDWSLASAGTWPGVSTDLPRRLSALRHEEATTRQAGHIALQRTLQDEAPAIIPVFADYTATVSDSVARPVAMGNIWELDNARFIERWWMA